MADWPGKSFFLMERWTLAADLQLQTNASGTVGYGAYFDGHWLSGRWESDHLQQDITFKELYAILVAVATWGHRWTRLRIEF